MQDSGEKKRREGDCADADGGERSRKEGDGSDAVGGERGRMEGKGAKAETAGGAMEAAPPGCHVDARG